MAENLEELKLVVTLTDNASAGLAKLQDGLKQLGQSSEGLSKFKRESDDVSRKIQDLLQKSIGLNESMFKLGANIRSVTLGAIGLVYAFNEAGDKLQQFARQNLEINTMARSAGLMAGEFRKISDQLEQLGYTADQAHSEIANFFNTISEAAHVGTPQFQKIMREATNPDVMLRNIQTWKNMIDHGEGAKALESAARTGQELFNRLIGKGVSRADATREVKAMFDNIGLSIRALDIDKLESASKKELEAMAERVKLSREFNKEWTESTQKLNDYIQVVTTMLLPVFKDVNQLLTWMVEKWGTILESVQAVTLALTTGGSAAAVILRLIGEVKLPEGTPPKAVHRVAPRAGRRRGGQPSELDELSKGLPGGGDGTAPAQHFTGGGDAYDYMPLSANVDDRRGVLAENTAQLRRLNDILMGGAGIRVPGGGALGLLSGGTGGGGGLGTGAGTLGGGAGGLGGVPSFPGLGGLPGFGRGPGGVPGYGGGGGGAPYGSDVGAGTGAGAGETPATGGTQQQHGAGGRANYFTGEPGKNLVTVDTAAGPITVNREAAPHMQGFVNDLVEGGAPIKDIGSYNKRRIAGSGRWSQHAYGNALDFDQRSRNVISPALRKWIDAHPTEWRAALDKHGMVSGGDWKNPDLGHVEWGGPKGTPGGTPAAGGGGGAPAAGGGAGAWGGGGDLAGSRAGFGAELQDPATRERLFRLAQAENPENPHAFMESVMNRASARGQTLTQAMNDRGYYPGVSLRGRDPGRNRARFESAMGDVLGGSNVTNYATGNASLNVGFGYGKGAKDPYTYMDPRTGERYGVENRRSDRMWAQRMREAGARPRGVGYLTDSNAATARDPVGAGSWPDASSLDRGWLDSAMGGEARVHGTGKITVDVNAPAGTKVGAEGGGLFKNVEVNRQVQMQKAESGPKQPAGESIEE